MLIYVSLIISIFITATSGAEPAAASPESWLVNRIVAAVNNEVITLRILEMECEIQLIIQATPGSRGPLRPHNSKDFQQRVLEGMINQILILEEAQRIGLAGVDKKELTSRLRDFQQRFPSKDEFSKFLRKWELTKEELKERFKAQIIVSGFIERMIVSLSEPEGKVSKEQAFQEKLIKQVEKLRAEADIRLMGTKINPKQQILNNLK